jgi:hypothetical protein
VPEVFELWDQIEADELSSRDAGDEEFPDVPAHAAAHVDELTRWVGLEAVHDGLVGEVLPQAGLDEEHLPDAGPWP